MQVENKTVIITGAASGIGAATAKLFARHGATVVASDMDLAGAERTVTSIEEQGGKGLAMQANVANHEEVAELVNRTVAECGQLDILVNNAGTGPRQMKKTGDFELSDWDRVILVNQTGVFYGMKYALQQMAKQGHGGIVNVASLAGVKASMNHISYAASKFAVVGMTKAAALEYAALNIRINAVCPGYTESALLDKLLSMGPKVEAILKRHIPMNRFCTAEEVAEAIVWLASDSTGYITGQAIVLDGGAQL
ncbi:MAG: SDR family NAD(P)-dependent oxidoreductase [Verrucomicrobia bacterium]|nr:SDR family NAD(P)-dependent oxidoreductase [Verrucomicrobiota bacterium]